MTYTEAIKALLAGKEVEVVSGGNVHAMRMHDEWGPQIEISPRGWVNANSGFGEFRECLKPQTFLGVWEEARSSAEAEAANALGTRAFCSDGLSLAIDNVNNLQSGWFWVRRIQPNAVPVEELRSVVDSPSRDDVTWRTLVINGIRALIAKYEGGGK